ncbi:MAG TPA: hypothetical protein VGR11_09900 [Solirubrobacteraceae bacterium]|nr:hypothetical protein [Solirubrobacteraceae bacterium]
MTGDESPAAGANAQPGADGASAPSAAVEPPAPAQTKGLNAVALAKEVILDRLQGLLEWLLNRLKRYRARRGNWWEK